MPFAHGNTKPACCAKKLGGWFSKKTGFSVRHYVAADQGFRILGELKQYIPEVQFTALSARQPWANGSASLVDDYLVAILKANRYLYDNKAGTVAIIQNFFKVQPDHAERVYEYWVRNQVTPRDGALTLPGTEVVLEILETLGDFKGKTRPKAEKFIDSSFLRRAQARISR